MKVELHDEAVCSSNGGGFWSSPFFKLVFDQDQKSICVVDL